jgi:hypothetical protein
MNISTKISKVDNSHRHAEILAQIQADFVQYFEQLVDDCCMRIDLEFGLHLAKDREKNDKEQQKKMLEYLRQLRQDLKQSYLLKVNSIFASNNWKWLQQPDDAIDLSRLTLANDDIVEEEYTITMIIRNCEHHFREELQRFNKQLALQMGQQRISERQNPIAPEKLVQALVEAVESLKLNSDFRIGLYKIFDAHVFSQLAFIYRELSQQFENGRLSEQMQPDTGSKASDAEAALLEAAIQPLLQKLALWRSTHNLWVYERKPDITARYESFEITQALDILQHGYGNEQNERALNKPLKWQVIKQLEALDVNAESKCLSEQDEAILDLVSMIFMEIQHDTGLPDSVKSALQQLQLPLAACCLGHCRVFVDTDNPVRRLIDNLFAAGLYLNSEDYADGLVRERIVDTCKRIITQQGSGLDVWQTEADEFSRYLEKQKQRSQVIEARTVQSVKNKEALDLSKQAVAKAMDNSRQGKALPAGIDAFLREVWQDVLLVDYLRKEKEPELWRASVQAMDELIMSVLPPTDDGERTRILKFLPGLVKALRNGLKRISYDKNAQSRFFKELAVWHIILMDKKAKDTTTIAAAETITATIAPEEIAPTAAPSNCVKQINDLAENSWVAFERASGRQWGKLIWKSGATETLYFVGKSGVKTFEFSSRELAEKFHCEQASIVELNENTLIERVLSQLMSL